MANDNRQQSSQPESARQAATPTTNGSATVTVACKIPNGLIMRVFDMVTKDQLVMGGGMRQVKEAQERPEQIVINGPNHPQNKAPECQILGGFALTPGIDKSFWDRWYEQNKGSMMVKNGLIFAHERSQSAEGEAKEKVGVKSGLERIDPDHLPKGIKPYDQKAA